MKERWLVTGASGFLGRQLCAELRAHGAIPRALVRPARETPADVERAEVTDLSDRAGLRHALDGVTGVMHLAARVHVMRDTEEDALGAFRRVNVLATRTLLEEAIDAGAGKFVFVSSVKAMGDAAEQPYTERSPARPVDPYGISKLEAESLVHAFASQSGLHATILRLPLVYGPGMKGNMLRLFDAVQRGIPIPVATPPNLRSIVFSGNVIAAILATATASNATCETYLVSDGIDISTADLARAVGRALGRAPRLVTLPRSVLSAVGRLGDAVGTLIQVPVSSAVIQRLGDSLRVDSSKLARFAGQWPPVTTDEGLRRTAQWFLTRERRSA